MRVVALVSGGKDSTYNMMQVTAEGHQVIALANLHPKDKDELDSYMYQTVGHQGIEKLAQAMELPLYRRITRGNSINTKGNYEPTEDDEVEDLYELLRQVKEERNVEAVAVGAILSDYQRVRVENVCNRLQLISLAYLWRRDQTELLQEMIDCQVYAIIIKVAALGLIPDRHLGKSLKEMQPHLLNMKDKYGLNVCGEGGEYETFTLDCPLFKSRIVVDDVQTVISSADPVCPVGYLNFTKLRLVPKERTETVVVKNSLDFIADLNESSYSDLSDPDLSETELELIEKVTNAKQRRSEQCHGAETSSQAMEIALKTLEDLITSNSFTLRQICYITLYVRDMNEYSYLNAIYSEKFGFTNPPTRVCVECPLPENCHVVLEAVAFNSEKSSKYGLLTDYSILHYYLSAVSELEHKRHTMHVQGISHWAPANIGTYSQSTKVGHITYISGQIALVPGSMTIVEGGIKQQCKLTLRHVSRIAKAMHAQGQLRDVVQGICFVTHPSYIYEARRQWERRTANAIMDYIVVPALPRGALVEWQVWAHTHNDKFDYEETGCSIGDYSISIRRRWNYENNCASVVCYVSTGLATSTTKLAELSDDFLQHHNQLAQSISREQIHDTIAYVLRKLLQDYPVGNSPTNESGSSSSDEQNNHNSHHHHPHYYHQVSHHRTTDGAEPTADSGKPTVHLRIFYQVSAIGSVQSLVEAIESFLSLPSNTVRIAYTVVPACHLQNFSTFISICGLRHHE
ncbi:AAEL009372-PB [Aedes aegypti]|uniref:Diphthine--ammonia ligase n=1 Tax=Aedes aegypti TaxID=7159 RepID=Q16W05_AEDAE|nr:AAEL009372-PA [Aedes aegypti]EAT38761.1 AAEL009372-PB [Aedes aegypti]